MPKLLQMGSLLLGICLVTGCEKKTDVDVNLHGVNYGGDAFSFYITDPANSKNKAAGSGIIDPFAAGGTTCCFTLPKKWRPGITVQVHTTHWLPQKPDGSLQEVEKVYFVDVPAYANGMPGELWVLRNAGGGVDIISSDFQPDHPSWPGKLKGWPVPSLTYRRERWELLRKHQENYIKLFVRLIDEIKKSPQEGSTKAWDHASKYDPEEIKGYTGPNDPRYIAFLEENYAQALKESREEFRKVMEIRP